MEHSDFGSIEVEHTFPPPRLVLDDEYDETPDVDVEWHFESEEHDRPPYFPRSTTEWYDRGSFGGGYRDHVMQPDDAHDHDHSEHSESYPDYANIFSSTPSTNIPLGPSPPASLHGASINEVFLSLSFVATVFAMLCTFISVWVFLQNRHMRGKPVFMLLLAFTASQFLFSAGSMVSCIEGIISHHQQHKVFPFFTYHFSNPCMHFFASLSVWLLVAVSLERLLRNTSIKYKDAFSKKATLYVIIVICIFSFLYNLVRFFDTEIVPWRGHYIKYYRFSPIVYNLYHIWLQALTHGLLPFLIISGVMLILFWVHLQKRGFHGQMEQNSQNEATTVVIILSLLYVRVHGWFYVFVLIQHSAARAGHADTHWFDWIFRMIFHVYCIFITVVYFFFSTDYKNGVKMLVGADVKMRDNGSICEPLTVRLSGLPEK